MPSWFDLTTLDISGPEDEKGIKKAAESITKMLDEEQSSSGIASNRILLGGFSQGGALALHTGLRYPKQLAGLAGLSCWVPLHKQYPAEASAANKDIPILQCHGDSDHIVPFVWGQMTSNILKELAPQSEFKVYKGLAHSSSDQVT